MFDFFKPEEKSTCPVDEKMRLWIENAILWLFQQFGEENIESKKVLLPNQVDFPIVFDKTPLSRKQVLNILAKQMDIAPDDVELEIYSEGPQEISTGAAFGKRYFLKPEEDEKTSSGLYWGKQENGKFYIGLEQRNLKDPEGLVATLADELSHIKLHGEKRIETNNEHLTDLTTVIFGLGVFNANAAFQFRNGFDSWGYNKLGYLSQMEWGYALALYTYLREENEPEWAKHLTANVKADFYQGCRFIKANEDLIFKGDDEQD